METNIQKIKVKCPYCATTLLVTEKFFNKAVQCLKCQKPIVIQSDSEIAFKPTVELLLKCLGFDSTPTDKQFTSLVIQPPPLPRLTKVSTKPSIKELPPLPPMPQVSSMSDEELGMLIKIRDPSSQPVQPTQSAQSQPNQVALASATPIFVPPVSVTPVSVPPVSATPASVPPASATPASATPVRKLSPRQRRLQSDEEETLEYFKDFPLIRIVSHTGSPAESYKVEYLIRGIERIENDKPIYRDQHLVEIHLDGTYPRTPPMCRMLTPIFHPNIEPAVICIGDHWSAQERLHNLIVRIGEIISYQSYNIQSPLDGFAARWADLHPEFLPTDSRFLMR